jgi:hypothetical protein
MGYKIWIFLVIFVQISLFSHSQSSCIIQSGKIVYECGHSDEDSIIRSNYAAFGNMYMQKYFQNNKVKLIYLCLNMNTLDTIPRFELSFDNLRGNSMENQLYERNRKFDKPGVRIKITSNRYHPLEFLKLLEYGIINIKKLRKARNCTISTDLYSRPDSVYLSQEEIKRILSQNLLHPIP